MDNVIYSAQLGLCKYELSDRDLCALNKVFEQSPSLYKLEKSVDIPLATLWRILKRLEEYGFIQHSKRGEYEVTLKGLFYLLMAGKSDATRIINCIAKRLKMEASKAYNLVKCLFNLANSAKICLLDHLGDLKFLAELAAAKSLEGVKVSKELLEFLWGVFSSYYPVIKVNGCEVLVMNTTEGPKILVGRCAKQGFVSNAYCPHLDVVANSTGLEGPVVLR